MPKIKKCIVTNCSASSKRFAVLPTDLETRDLWLRILQREDLLLSRGRHLVCYNHFRPEMIVPSGRCVRTTAIPFYEEATAFTPNSVSLQGPQQSSSISKNPTQPSLQRGTLKGMPHRLDEVCRVCESTEDLEIISNNSNRDILSMLQDVGQSKIRGRDYLPHRICHPCIFTLKDFHEFKLLYRSTYAKLKFGITSIPMQLKVFAENVTVQDSSVVDIFASCVKKEEMELRPSCIRADENTLKKGFDLKEEFTNKTFLDLHGSNQVKNSDFYEMVVKEEIAVQGEYGEQELQAKTDNTNDVSELENEKLEYGQTHVKRNQTSDAINKINFKLDESQKLKESFDVGTMVSKDCNDQIYNENRKLLENAQNPIKKKVKHSNPDSYKCNVCSKSFTLLKSLKRHKAIHFNRVQCGCKVCGKSFLTKEYLKEHQRLHNEALKCEVCGKIFTRADRLNAHKALHSNPTLFQCNECGKCYTTPDNLKKHQARHSEPDLYKCEECGKIFKKSESLKQHKILHFDPTAYSCNICGKSLSCLATLKRHTCLNRTKFVYNTSKNLFSSAKTSKKDQILPTDAFKCEPCGKIFARADRLYEHRALHLNPVLFQCNDCGKCYNTAKKFREHQIFHTNPERWKSKVCGKSYQDSNTNKREAKPVLYKCDECGKCFKRSITLKKHHIVHTDPNRCKCKFCGKSFQDTHKTKRHEKLHSKPVLYKCDECGKCFKKAGTLKEHQILHSDPNAYSCDICDKSFSDSRALKEHTNIHLNGLYKCEICYKSYMYRYTLTRHMLIHSDGNLHECRKCGKSFANADNLRGHQVLHTDKFKCEICGKTFSRARQVHRHKALHSNPALFQCNDCDKFVKTAKRLEHQALHSNPESFHLKPKVDKCDKCGHCYSKKYLKKHKCRRSLVDICALKEETPLNGIL